MPAFSYTAPIFTKQDEEKEKSKLTNEEKEIILDDIYGRNLPTSEESDSEDEDNTQVDGDDNNGVDKAA